MKQLPFVFISALLFISFSTAQAQTILKQVLVLQMPEDDGSNSASVVWHPLTKKYYTSMAGNASYPMGVFNEKGKLIQDDMDADYAILEEFGIIRYLKSYNLIPTIQVV